MGINKKLNMQDIDRYVVQYCMRYIECLYHSQAGARAVGQEGQLHLPKIRGNLDHKENCEL